MTDQPTSGTTVTDSDQWYADITGFGLVFDYNNTALPFELAISSPSSTSTVAISCQTGASYNGGGSGVLTFQMSNGRINAVQTTTNS
jgi:hypothetical protein